jgi:tetratricopeptide (TPR) repeat protein
VQSTRLRIGLGLAIALATIWVYAPVRHHEYVDLDDYAGILLNPDLQVHSLREALVVSFTRPVVSSWVPLATLSLQLDRALYGEDPTGTLVTNVLLHVATALLLFHVFTRMTRDAFASAFVAAVFALHPLHVESVAWASERKDVVAGLFFALTLLAYLRYVERPESRLRFALVLVGFALGLLAKPMLVTLPGVLLLLDFWPLRRLDVGAVREKLPLFALAAVDAYATFAVQGATGAMSYGLGVPLSLRVANAIDATCAYLGQTVWPSGLAVFYPHALASLGRRRVALELALLAALTLAAWLARRRQPWWLTGWLWYLGTLVPVLGFVQVGMQGRADRYTYLPMIGLALAVAFGARELARTRAARIVLAAAATAALAAFAFAASAQVGVWRDSFTLYERAIAVSPQASFPYLRLGMVYAMRGNFGEALPRFRRSVELDPSSAKEILRQLDSMASGHAEQGRPAEAVGTASFAISFAEETRETETAAAIRARLPALRGER